jgi:hypothetical protein
MPKEKPLSLPAARFRAGMGGGLEETGEVEDNVEGDLASSPFHTWESMSGGERRCGPKSPRILPNCTDRAPGNP